MIMAAMHFGVLSAVLCVDYDDFMEGMPFSAIFAMPAFVFFLNFPAVLATTRRNTRAILHDQDPKDIPCCGDVLLFLPCFIVPFGQCALAQQARAVKRQWVANGQEPLAASTAIDWKGEHEGEPNWVARPVMPIPPIAPGTPAITLHNPMCGSK
jgi:hypothetical protein